MGLLLKLLLLPIWLPLKLLGELMEHSVRRSFHPRRYRRGPRPSYTVPAGCWAAAGIVILVGIVAELGILAWQTAPWLDVAGVVGAVVVVAVIVLSRRSTTASDTATVSSAARIYGRPELVSPTPTRKPRTCALCGAQGRDTYRVSRSDESVSIRVCAGCAERIRSADPELSAKAMQMLNEPIQ